MTKAIHPTTLNAMESLFEEKITGLQLLSLFHQELRGSLAGGCVVLLHGWVTPKAELTQTGNQKSPKREIRPLKEKKKENFSNSNVYV